MNKFIVAKPRGDVKLGDSFKDIEVFDINKVGDIETFIQDRVGNKPINKLVGDYVVWFNDPSEIYYTELDEAVPIPDEFTNTPNLLINEELIAFGNVVFTSNVITNNGDLYYGLDDIDYANIINSFVDAGQSLVEHEETETTVVVDRIFNGLLNPSNVIHEDLEEPVIEEIEVDDDKESILLNKVVYEDEELDTTDYYDAPASGTDEDFDTIGVQELEDMEQEYLNSL